MQNAPTLYDLNKTAVAAAESAFGKDQLAMDSIKVEAFNAAGHDRIDYPKWEQMFNDARASLAFLKSTAAPSATAAKLAADQTAKAAAAS